MGVVAVSACACANAWTAAGIVMSESGAPSGLAAASAVVPGLRHGRGADRVAQAGGHPVGDDAGGGGDVEAERGGGRRAVRSR